MTNPNEPLRAVRLWHFQQLTQASERAKVCPSTTECVKQMALADKHRAFVAALDTFFMAGDTAEGDAARVRA